MDRGTAGGGFVDGIIGGHKDISFCRFSGMYQQEYHRTFDTSIHYFQPILSGIFGKNILMPFLGAKKALNL